MMSDGAGRSVIWLRPSMILVGVGIICGGLWQSQSFMYDAVQKSQQRLDRMMQQVEMQDKGRLFLSDADTVSLSPQQISALIHPYTRQELEELIRKRALPAQLTSFSISHENAGVGVDSGLAEYKLRMQVNATDENEVLNVLRRLHRSVAGRLSLTKALFEKVPQDQREAGVLPLRAELTLTLLTNKMETW